MLYLHLFSSFFHFRLYSTSQISDIAVPHFLYLIIPVEELGGTELLLYEEIVYLMCYYWYHNAHCIANLEFYRMGNF